MQLHKYIVVCSYVDASCMELNMYVRVQRFRVILLFCRPCLESEIRYCITCARKESLNICFVRGIVVHLNILGIITTFYLYTCRSFSLDWTDVIFEQLCSAYVRTLYMITFTILIMALHLACSESMILMSRLGSWRFVFKSHKNSYRIHEKK